ncbi:MAG: hypothetical protein NVV73_21290 [Cellvibrionaceae bacterium]|nr:hypothetical protein [Cellvibrionaceae bacterium]
MNKNFRFSLSCVLLFSTVINGCAVGPARKAFTPESAGSVKSAKPYNLVIQDEVTPSVEMSNVAGAMMAGGLYGALPALIGSAIDSSVNKKRNQKAQEVMENFYGNTDDFDYRESLAANLNPVLESALPISVKNAPAEFMLLSNKEREARISALAPGEALVYTSSFYRFVDQSKVVVSETQVYVYTKSAKSSKGGTKPIFFNRFINISNSVGTGGESSLQLWSENSGKLYRDSMDEAAKRIAAMVAYDIKAQKTNFCGKPVKANTLNMMAMSWLNATMVEEKGDWVMIQDASGALQALPKQSVQDNPKAKPKKCA